MSKDDPNKNLFKRGNVWWLEATVQRNRIKESLRTGDVLVARQKRDKRIEELKRSGGERLAWDKVVDQWAEWFSAKKSKSYKTSLRYLVSLRQVQPFMSRFHIDKIDGKVILDLIKLRKKQGVSEPTIRRDLTAVSAILKFAEDNNWREGNPAIAKRRMLEENTDPIALPTEAEISAVLAHCPWRFAALVQAARLTGCRQAELVLARWDMFNPSRRTLTVIGKGSKRRTIDLSDAAYHLLHDHPRVLGSDLIFCREDGSAFTQAASDFCFFRREANATRKTPIAFRFHDLRHLYAVEALHGGMSIYRLQQQLGHTTIAITERYLEFLSPEEKEHAKRGEVLERPENRQGTAVGESSTQSPHPTVATR